MLIAASACSRMSGGDGNEAEIEAAAAMLENKTDAETNRIVNQIAAGAAVEEERGE